MFVMSARFVILCTPLGSDTHKYTQTNGQAHTKTLDDILFASWVRPTRMMCPIKKHGFALAKVCIRVYVVVCEEGCDVVREEKSILSWVAKR